MCIRSQKIRIEFKLLQRSGLQVIPFVICPSLRRFYLLSISYRYVIWIQYTYVFPCGKRHFTDGYTIPCQKFWCSDKTPKLSSFASNSRFWFFCFSLMIPLILSHFQHVNQTCSHLSKKREILPQEIIKRLLQITNLIDNTTTYSFGKNRVFPVIVITLDIQAFPYLMMTSSNGNIFRVTGHLCGEFTGYRWISRTKASDAQLWCFLWSAPE